MIALAEARALVSDSFATRRLGAVTVPLAEALGRVLAENLVAPRDVPGFAHSAMDGFALRGAELESSAIPRLRLIGTMLAGGTAALTVGPGECVRIMTGAPMPAGADTVALQENCRLQGDEVEVGETRPGANVRAADDDYAAGAAALGAGQRLGPAQIAVAAEFGLTGLSVRARPRVAALITGDELVSAPAPLGFGQRYDSNAALLAALLAQHGASASIARVRDRFDAIADALLAAAGAADLIVTTGGASVGEADFLPAIMEKFGRIEFQKVRMRPGMPVLFGWIGATPLLALPGNPASVYATFVALVRPALAGLSGCRAFDPAAILVRLAEKIDKRHSRLELRRARLERSDDGSVHAHPHPVLSSGALKSLAESDALIELAAAQSSFERDTLLPAYPLNLAFA
jgi:molybdopterin molybdotransferase